MLTKKQNELLGFISERLKVSSVSPSYDEMKDALGLQSKSGIHRLVLALVERGFVRRLPHRARAIEILKMPGTSHAAPAAPRLVESTGGSRALPFVSIPMMGRIAAGTPISAIQQKTHSIGMPPDMLSSGEHYALEVRGDSMIEAGIFDADTVIIRRQDHAANGDIIVALIDDDEATLKRFRKRGTSIALEAANPAYETRLLPSDRVSIQGKLVGLTRKY